MIQAAIMWWVQQLRSLLPKWLHHRDASLPDATIVDCGALGAPVVSAAVLRRRGRRETPVGPLPAAQPHRGAMVLRLAGTPLQRETVVPAPLEADIPAILANDMGRLTPFEPAEIAWTYRVVRRNPARNLLTVQLSYIPRNRLTPALDWLRRQHCEPGTLELSTPDGPVYRLPLRPPARRAATRQWLGAAGIAAALAATATPFALQSIALDQLDAQIAAIRPAAQQAETLRARMATHEPGPAAHAAEARRVGDTLATLAALSNALPDDTTLADIALHGRKLAVTGTSAQASLLIAALSGIPLMRDPAFDAPIVHDLAAARDSFSLHTDITP